MSEKDPRFAPAFPITAGNEVYARGLTLRDYFAGQALAGILANPHNRREALIIEMGKDAYRFADAMLAQREKG